jgi:alpha-1,2-rhamnosyltransferase
MTEYKKPPTARRRRRRLYIECTCTYLYGGNSGIQRVVRSIVNRCKQVGKKEGVRCQPVVSTGDRFVTVRAVDIRGRFFYTATMRLKDIARRLAKFVPLIIPLKFLRSSRLVGELRAAAGKILKIVGKPVLNYISRMLHKKVEFEEGDVLLLLDSSWHIPIWDGVSKAKKKGARVGVVVYDLIPIHLPEACDQNLVRVFRSWLPVALSHADFFITISNAVGDELQEYLRSAFFAAGGGEVSIQAFRLGADLDKAKRGTKIRQHILDVLTRPELLKPYLTVCTIEPRKNHEYLLDAFDKVWSKGIRAPLVIVGKIGWLCDHIIERIRTHPQWQKLLFMFNDLNDAELSYCYKVSKALVFPSKYEGFGLPIVEALRENLIVLASDIPVHREVGGEYCRYFNLSSPQSLAKLILNYERNGHLPPAKPPDSFSWPDWKQSCRELIQKASDLAELSHE